jgi:hypothetical protein
VKHSGRARARGAHDAILYSDFLTRLLPHFSLSSLRYSSSFPPSDGVILSVRPAWRGSFSHCKRRRRRGQSSTTISIVIQYFVYGIRVQGPG